MTGAVGTIVLNRPERRNALSRAMIAELQQAFGDLHLEKRVRAIVLTGAGTAFCAGMDVHEMHSLDGLPDAGESAAVGRDGRGLSRAGRPDDRVAEADHRVGQRPGGGGRGGAGAGERHRGGGAMRPNSVCPIRGAAWWPASSGRCWRFAWAAGPAARLLLTSSLYPADEAYRLGIYHEMIDEARLWARCVADRRRMCRRGAGSGAAHQAAALRNDRRATGDAAIRRRGDERDVAHDRSGPGGAGGVCREAAAGVEVTKRRQERIFWQRRKRRRSDPARCCRPRC